MEEKKYAWKVLDDIKKELSIFSDTIWLYAEVGMQEYESSQLLIDFLEKNGFKIIQGVAKIPTAFVAEYGTGKPVIGIDAEYDALPEISNKTIPEREPIIDGGPGHGCGHNAFGVGSSAAAVALAKTMEEFDFKGKIKLFGCPAEEMCIGKAYMVRAGVYDGTDAVLTWHPGARNTVRYAPSNAYDSIRFVFNGISSHGNQPWNGRDALAAVEMMDQMMNVMRGYFQHNTTMNRAILDSSKFATVLSNRAEVWYVFRNPSREYANVLREYVKKAAKGASDLTECPVEMEFITGVYPRLPNEYLAKVQYSNLEAVGAPKFTEKEKEFAKKLQETYPAHMGYVGGGQAEGVHLDETLMPPRGHRFGDYMGTSDEGDVSWVAPLVSLSTACHPIGCPGHSWQKVAAVGTSIAHKGLLIASKTLAGTGIDLFLKKEHLKNALSEFENAKAGRVYESVIPADVDPKLDWHTEYQNEYRAAMKSRGK